MDEFEQFLKRQPLRTIPPEWKAEILFVERNAGPGGDTAATKELAWWREWLWPSPVAWAGLAGVWLMIFALNWASGPTAEEREIASRTPARSPEEIAVALAEQRRALAQLLGSPAAPPAVRRPNQPGPRSEFIGTIEEA